MSRDIFLLDVDSVLVRPLGYRESLRDTVNHFGLRMNQPPGALTPSYEEIDAFESANFTNEWDSTPVCLVAFLQIADDLEGRVWRETLDATMTLIARRERPFPRPNYTEVFRAIAADQPNAKVAGHKALAYFLAHTDRSRSETLLRRLFTNTADIRVPTTRAFQHYVLGSEVFAETYGSGPDFEAESRLLSHDRPLLDAAGRARLLDAGVTFVLYTARPSHPPQDVDPLGFAPEAELAQALLGLEQAPLLGAGPMRWLAGQTGAHPDSYVKPSAVQALAAIGAAQTGDLEQALWAAAALADEAALRGPLAALGDAPLRVTVFEDWAGGIRGVRAAGEMLRAAGVPVTVRGVGVSDSAVKQAALQPVADVVVSDVNAGLAWALEG